MHGAQFTPAKSGRIFNRSSSVGDRDVMKLLHLLRRTTLEANRPAICGGGWFAVNWFANTKRLTVVAVEQSGLASAVDVLSGLAYPEYSEHCVIEAF
jgi:hypothetical protein